VQNQDLIYSAFGIFLLAQALSCGTVGWIVPNLSRIQRLGMRSLGVVLGVAGVIALIFSYNYHS